jgi:hypothetical protein
MCLADFTEEIIFLNGLDRLESVKLFKKYCARVITQKEVH